MVRENSQPTSIPNKKKQVLRLFLILRRLWMWQFKITHLFIYLFADNNNDRAFVALILLAR